MHRRSPNWPAAGFSDTSASISIKTIEQLQIVAEIDKAYPRQAMSRSERLERWAELLERTLTGASDAAPDRVSAG